MNYNCWVPHISCVEFGSLTSMLLHTIHWNITSYWDMLQPWILCSHLFLWTSLCLPFFIGFYVLNFSSSQMSYWIMFLMWPAGHSLLTFMSALNSLIWWEERYENSMRETAHWNVRWVYFHPNLHFTATSYSLLLIFSTFLVINSIHFLSPWYLHSSKTSAWLPIFIFFPLTHLLSSKDSLPGSVFAV